MTTGRSYPGPPISAPPPGVCCPLMDALVPLLEGWRESGRRVEGECRESVGESGGGVEGECRESVGRVEGECGGRV